LAKSALGAGVPSTRYDDAGGARLLARGCRPAACRGAPRLPLDTDAHYSIKRSATWTGYKVRVTGACDPEAVHLTTRVETTPAHLSDLSQTAAIHQDVGAKELLPDAHLVVDAGCVDGGLVDAGRTDYAVELVDPIRPDTGWQARTPGCCGYFSRPPCCDE